MSWRETVEHFFTNWSEPHKSRMLAALAEENDMAEELGFTCEIDERRGHGWCKFKKDRDTVWEVARGWARATLDDQDRYQNHRYFHTLSQALKDEDPHGRLGRYGTFERITSAAE